MRGRVSSLLTAVALAWPGTALADAAPDFAPDLDSRRELPPYLQCVPYARERSGVQIYGDAHTWWGQAEGRYRRGTQPKAGAVMSFRPTGAMVLGHVAAVAKVVDSRTVLLDHANWSPIDGRRGQIERGVKAVDVSAANDWSQVRVWFAPLGDLGTTAWPVAGFIYADRDKGTSPAAPFGGPRVLASAPYAPPVAQPPITPTPSKKFADAFAGFTEPAARSAPVRSIAAAAVGRKPVTATRPRDAIDAALSRYDRP